MCRETIRPQLAPSTNPRLRRSKRKAVSTMLEPFRDPAMVTACSGAAVLVCREIRATVDWWWPDRRAKPSRTNVKKRKK